MSNQNSKPMVYHVIIALNGTRKRKVGDVISLLEKTGLEFMGIQRKITAPSMSRFLNPKQLIFEYQVKETEAMAYYTNRFTPNVLKRKLTHFYGNHVELIFENEEQFFNPDELWNSIFKNVFRNGRKLPIMFVTTSSGENGILSPFITDSFEPDAHYRFRTLMPLGEM